MRFGARLPTDPSIKLVSKLCDRTDRLWPLFHGSRDETAPTFSIFRSPSESPVENKLRCGLVSFFSLFVLSFVVHARDEKITDVFGSRGRFDFGDRSSFLDLAIEFRSNGMESKRNETKRAQLGWREEKLRRWENGRLSRGRTGVERRIGATANALIYRVPPPMKGGRVARAGCNLR